MNEKFTYMPGDILLSRGNSWLSKAIRFFSRSFGESRTKVNHAAIIVEGANFVGNAIIVEALATVKKHSIQKSYGDKNQSIAIFRPINLTDDQINLIVRKAEGYVGKTYGFLKIFTHMLDWALNGAYVFRRFTNSGKYPICSYLVAYSFAVANKHFGVEPGQATPDDIWDFVTLNKDKYTQIRELRNI